ncbi:MAG: hypothetical protein ACYCWE_06360 [Eubacteriales bacterium]
MRNILFVLLILALLSAIFVSCSEQSESSETAAKPAVTSAETEDPNARENVKDNLPDELDFENATVNIWIRGSTVEQEREDTGDVIDTAIFIRNRNVEERLNVKFAFSFTEQNTFGSKFKTYVLSGTDDYDVIFPNANSSVNQGLNASLYDFNDVPYVDLEQPWWWEKAIIETSIDGKTFNYLLGDAMYTDLTCTTCFYYNKKVYADYISTDIDAMYETVYNNEWTYELLDDYCKLVYTDVNGDSLQDAGDRYGFRLQGPWPNAVMAFFTFTTDVEWYNRDENGYPVLTMNNERMYTMIERLYALFDGNGIIKGDDDASAHFASDLLLFYPFWLGSATTDILRAMESDYGIIPFPKLDDSQDGYRSFINRDASVVCLPLTLRNADMSGAVIEALGAEAYRTVTASIFEVAMKSKYTRDNISGQMMDSIVADACCNFVHQYGDSLSGIDYSISTLFAAGKTDFASYYAKNEKSLQKQLATLIAAVSEN